MLHEHLSGFDFEAAPFSPPDFLDVEREYTVYTMKGSTTGGSAVLTIRVSRALDRKLAREARRLRRTRSETARALLESALQETPDEDPAVEAQRQSRLASRRASEREALAFVIAAADLRGWE